MPLITVYVEQSDLDAATRIASKMFPPNLGVLETRHIIGAAFVLGMKELCKIWNEDTAEDSANAYADAKIRQQKLDGPAKPEHDTTPDGMQLKEGS